MSNPHRFRKTGPRAYAVTVADTGADLGRVDRVSPDHHRAAKWRAIDPAGESIGSHYPTRDYAAHALADAATERASAAAYRAADAPTTTPRTVDDPRVTTDPAERAVLLAAAARLDALPTDDEPEPERTGAEWVAYCPTHRHYVVFAGATGTTWTDEQDAARRYTKREAGQVATRATWRDHNPTPWPLPDAAAELVTYRSTGGGAYELADEAQARAEHPDAYAVIDAATDAIAATEATTAPAVDVEHARRLLARYAHAVSEWQADNLAQEDAPDVRACTRYSDRLEELAHAFASLARDLVPDYAAPVVIETHSAYACGREHSGRGEVTAPEPATDLAEWLQEAAAPFTGDGHSCGSSEHAMYEAVVTGAPGRPELVGLRTESEG